MVTVDASPSTLPADGTSTSTITITATDSNGDPVAGDAMTVFTRDDNATPGTCGTLSNNSDVNGDAGNALITNTAGQVARHLHRFHSQQRLLHPGHRQHRGHHQPGGHLPGN